MSDGLSSLLLSLPSQVHFDFNTFYSYPANCLSLFQSFSVDYLNSVNNNSLEEVVLNDNEENLPKIAKEYKLAQLILLRLLFVHNPNAPYSLMIPLSYFKKLSTYVSGMGKALVLLRNLRILGSSSKQKGFVELNSNFQKNLKMFFSSSLHHYSELNVEAFSFLSPNTLELKQGSKLEVIKSIQKHSEDQWESILHFLVNPESGSSSLSKSITQILMNAGLIQTGNSGSIFITKFGFEFLLQSRKNQMWIFLQRFVKSSPDPTFTLSFILEFGMSLPGIGYQLKDSLQEASKISLSVILRDLSELGLVFFNSNYYYPSLSLIRLTSMTGVIPDLGLNLGSSPNVSTSVEPNEGEGFIILETNFRLYAYAKSSLQIAILGLFTSLQCRFENLVCGSLNQQSMKDAFDAGITADQIITYLSAHAHPEMKKSMLERKFTTLLPPSVCDQIRLWEKDRKRLSYHLNCTYYHEFNTQSDFEKVLAFVKENVPSSSIIFVNSEKRHLILASEYHNALKDFIKSQIN